MSFGVESVKGKSLQFGTPLPRRAVLAAGAGALATGLGPTARRGHAAVVVTPDPIPARVTFGTLRLAVQEFSTPPSSSATAPRSLLHYLFHAGDGTGRLYCCDSRGTIWAINATGGATAFLQLAAIRGTAFVRRGNEKYMGLRTFAFHPDFARAGRRGFRRFYTLSTETPSSAPADVPILGDQTLPRSHHDVLAEWQVDAAGNVLVGSRREVLRIHQPSAGHNGEQLLFDHSVLPGGAGYGMLFISVGDGKNNPTGTDPYNQAQNLARPLGKILRINPLQSGTRSYTVPPTNPFFNRPGALPEIWALGLRNPQFMCFDPAKAGRMIFSSTGQRWIESIYRGVKGANHGWPDREGTFVTERTNELILYAPPADDSASGFEFPVAQYDRSEGEAICSGFVYRGTAIPALQGHYLFGDKVNGRVFAVRETALRRGSQATIQEVRLFQDGAPFTLRGLLGASVRVDLHFGQDQAGEIYMLTKYDGKIRKLLPA